MTIELSVHTYERASSAVFRKITDPYGGFSNMASGYPISINGLRVRTSEALYQVCRFPHLPEVQRIIIAQASPMAAKMKGKPYRSQTRPDWDQVQVPIMRWCLQVKLAQNWKAFSRLLLVSGDRPIVEDSARDAFWGAKEAGPDTLVGQNVLGQLLMELRQRVRDEPEEALKRVAPPALGDFLMLGSPIGTVLASGRME